MTLTPYAIFIAFSAPVVWGLVNMVDQRLSRHFSFSWQTLIFISALTKLLFLPILFPSLSDYHFVSWTVVGLGAMITGFKIISSIPYYLAMRVEDTSIVTSSFLVGDAIIPFIAYIVLAEHLTLLQYLGVAIVLLSGYFAVNRKRFAPNSKKASFYMFTCAFFYALQHVAIKYGVDEYGWEAIMIWRTIAGVFLVAPFLLHKAVMPEIRRLFNLRHEALYFLLVGKLLAFFAVFINTYAATLMPITILKSIKATQPMIVLLMSAGIGLFAKHWLSEDTSMKGVRRKLPYYAVMLIGVMLILQLIG